MLNNVEAVNIIKDERQDTRTGLNRQAIDKINEIRLKMFCKKADIFIPDENSKSQTAASSAQTAASKLYKFYMGED